MKNNLIATPPHKNNGFTLAETLITLVIIGVIAALTVPTLINKVNNQDMVARLKKAYSTMSQATNLIIAEEGTPNASKGGWASSNANIYNLYKKKLLNAKTCDLTTGCFEQIQGGYYKLLNGNYDNQAWNENENVGKLILSDGTQVMFQKLSDNCSSSYFGTNNRCAKIHVDLNGAKKPNQWGRDLFQFVIRENGLVPGGCDDLTTCVEDGGGFGCACKVLKENAMNY